MQIGTWLPRLRSQTEASMSRPKMNEIQYYLECIVGSENRVKMN